MRSGATGSSGSSARSSAGTARLFPPGCDVVFVAKPHAPGIGYHELREEVLRARHALANAAERVLRREEQAP